MGVCDIMWKLLNLLQTFNVNYRHAMYNVAFDGFNFNCQITTKAFRITSTSASIEQSHDNFYLYLACRDENLINSETILLTSLIWRAS